MFARTERLTLRPGWAEDAPALAAAIAHPDVAYRLARLPWPYALTDAETFLAERRRIDEPTCLVFRHAGGRAELIGGVGLHREDGTDHTLGYWLTPAAWGHGYATEAAGALVRAARDSLRLKRLTAWHWAENLASGRVLRKLGFRPTGTIEPRASAATGTMRSSVGYALDLSACDGGDCDDPAPMRPIALAA